MEVVDDLDDLGGHYRDIVITIGNFDGVHLGHQRIIKEVLKTAHKIGGKSVVLTFLPHPLEVVAPHRKPALLATFTEKIELISRLGVDILTLIKFDSDFAKISSEDFVEKILCNKLHIKGIIVGGDYAFGEGRSGNVNTLKEAGGVHNFMVKVVKPIKVNGVTASSTNIRSLIRTGRMVETKDLLGRYYSVLGRITERKVIGKKAVYTLQVDPNKLIPPKGAYQAMIEVDGLDLYGVAEIATKQENNIDLHIPDKDLKLSEKDLSFEFYSDSLKKGGI